MVSVGWEYVERSTRGEESMRKMQTVYQVVFVMFDGAELMWKIFAKVEHY